ncbi:hypothetical protein SEA_HOTFRIES_34 [Streptomyces phage HotFries]|nr:hypothetical protein SEA_HOTFRIES_34 [Streptomyces phage HotFries]
MSANTAKNVAATAEEKVTVPAQNKNEKLAADVQEAVAANTMIDALKKVEDQLADGVTVKVTVDEDGAVSLEVVDSKVKSLAGKAKGVFQRNKKLVMATAGLAAASLVLKVIARRNAELEADEVVESSDDVAVDA